MILNIIFIVLTDAVIQVAVSMIVTFLALAVLR